MSSLLPFCKAGLKNGSPPIWSMWEWLIRIGIAFLPWLPQGKPEWFRPWSPPSPRSRIPVPASRMRESPPYRTSTQEVLPPTLTVAGPGAGTEPRVPQKRTRTGRLFFLKGVDLTAENVATLGQIFLPLMRQVVNSLRMPRAKNISMVAVVFLCCLQWIWFKINGSALPSPWNAVSPGIAIFGAAFVLSWGAELAQFEIPQSLAIAFLALIAVLPEYAVDMYFAWEAGKDPAYIHYATANMTGANRLLIGVGWAAVAFAYFFKTKKGEVNLEPVNRIELFALSAATLYCFVVPLKQTLSWIDSLFLLAIFAWYMFQVTRTHHEEPEIEGPIAALAAWPRGRRLAATLFFFLFSGYTIFISAEPFAEGLLETGRHLGIEEFILVQWLAPLASESPEFIVAILFALRAKASASLGTLISSKVNQWTLLVGMLPLIYNLSAGRMIPMAMDARQSEEIFLTAAQSLFALVVIANLRFSITEALMLFVLFATQLFFTSTEARNIYAFLYIAMAVGWFFLIKDNRKGFALMFREGFRRPGR